MLLISYLLLYLVFNRPIEIVSSAEDANDREGSEEELKNAPPDPVTLYSEHEDPPEPPTKPKYRPGEWAKPPPDKDIPLDFIPLQIYAQVRRTHSVKRVPREEGIIDADTDEEKETSAKLKEAVTNKKVHTIYTEEGYEDAGYDHGGHIRDADFQETYKTKSNNEGLNKNKFDNQIEVSNEVSRPDSEEFENDDDDYKDPIKKSSSLNGKILEKKKYYVPTKRSKISHINPKATVEIEINKLEEDLKKEDEEAAQGAESDVPQNLKNLGNINESSDDKDNEKNDSPENFNTREMARDASSYEVSPSENSSSENSSHSTIMSEYETSPQEISNRADEIPESTTVDYGKIFWDFYKTEKSEAPTEDFITTTVKTTPENSEVYSFSRTKANGYPSLSTIYESWKTRGIEQMFEQSSPNVHKTSEFVTLHPQESTSEVINRSSETTTRLPKKPDYVTIIRPPKDNSVGGKWPGENESDYSNFNVLNRFQNSVEPESLNIRAVKNRTVPKVPAPLSLGQVTYANSLQSTYGGLNQPSSMSDESESSQEIDQGSLEYGSPIRARRPQYNQMNLFQMAGANLRRYLGQLMHLLPPSPVGYSEYADYIGDRRSGTVKPQRDSRPVVFSYLRPPQQVSGKLPKRAPKKLIKGERKSGVYRKKRSSNTDLLNDVPKIVEEVIDEEIRLRFPKDSNDDADESREELGASKEQIKMDAEVLDLNFNGPDEAIKNYQEPSVPLKPQEVVGSTKYSYYYNDEVPMSSALKYIINPVLVPKKTHGGTEFYDSRHNYLQCPEIEPDLTKVAPTGEEDDLNRTASGNSPRLKNLGEKLSCLRAMYFDRDPLDNPLFNEEFIDTPEIPKELYIDSHRMASSLSKLGGDHEVLISQKNSRKPDVINSHTSSSNKNEVIQSNKKYADTSYNRKRQRGKLTVSSSEGTPYQKEVYEDVMGTIKNLGKMRQAYEEPIQFPRTIWNKSSRKSPVTIPKHLPESSHPRLSQNQWRYKYMPYKTDKVTYTTRPRTETLPGGEPTKIVGYFKTVRVNKRSISPIEYDLQVNGSENFQKVDNTSSRRRRKPKIVGSTTSSPNVVGGEASRKIYTISDRLRYSKPKDFPKYGKFSAGNRTSAIMTRRNEPRYSPLRNPEEFHETEYSEKDEHDAEEEKDAEGEIHGGTRNRTARYDVHEDVEENLPSEHSTSAGESGQSESVEKDESEGNEQNIQDEQVERPSDQYPMNSSEKPESSVQQMPDEKSSEESHANEESSDESYTDEEKNVDEMSESEKEFDRFGYRPHSFPNLYDSGYSYIRSRINKPDFHHPKFERPDYERKSAKESQQVESDEKDVIQSKYVFPWHQDEDSSAESRSSERLRYEYPWEKRERLVRQRDKKREKYGSFEDSDGDGESAGTMFQQMRIYPWDRYDIPSKKRGMEEKFWSEEIFDNHKMGSEIVPKEFSSRIKSSEIRSPNSRIGNIRRSVIDFVKSEIDGKMTEDITTTFKPQIPPTSATLPPRRKTTTPMIETTTSSKRVRYTIKPKSSRPHWSRRENYSLTSATASPRVTSTPKLIRRRGRLAGAAEAEKNNNNDRSSSIKTRIRSRMSTTTSATPGIRSRNRRRFEKISDKPEVSESTPVRTVEHRSKTTKEEIITRTQQGVDTPGNHTSINKLSITTKETPDHIYRIEKIDKDGVIGKVITITPNNNNTSSPIGTTDNITIDDDDIGKEEAERNQEAEEDVRNSAIDPYFAGGSTNENIFSLANMMQQLPLPMGYEDENSGMSMEENFTTKSEIKFIKEPDQRFYNFVED